MHIAVKLLLLICFWLSLLIFFSTAAYLSVHALFGVESPENIVAGIISNTNDANAFLYVTFLSSSLSFLVTALLMARLESYNPLAHLGLHVGTHWKKYALAIGSILAAQFFISYLVEINSKIPLPGPLSFLRQKNDELMSTLSALLNFKSPMRFVVVAFCMALAPAVAEEMFFRGLLMGNLLKAKVPPFWAIFISGLLFALIHFEFNNTLAIWVLGMFLGYLYYITGSLWVAIAAHFINNFMAVLLAYLYHAGHISEDLANATAPWYLVAVSFILFMLCLFVFKLWKKRENAAAAAAYNTTNPTNSI